MELSNKQISELVDLSERRRGIKPPLEQRDHHYRRFYGITLQDYNDLYEQQKGKCKLCKIKKSRLEVDHNHLTKKVRGLLCGRCNTKLGNIESWLYEIDLVALAKYLD